MPWHVSAVGGGRQSKAEAGERAAVDEPTNVRNEPRRLRARRHGNTDTERHLRNVKRPGDVSQRTRRRRQPHRIRRKAQVTQAVTCGAPRGFVQRPINRAGTDPHESMAANALLRLALELRVLAAKTLARPTSLSKVNTAPVEKHPRMTDLASGWYLTTSMPNDTMSALGGNRFE